MNPNPCLRSPFSIAFASLALCALLPLGTGDSGESQLLPPMSPPDADASGKVEVSKEGSEQEFKVSAQKLPTLTPPGPFEVWLEETTGSQSFFKVSEMALVSASAGRWEVKLESKSGAPASLGMADVDDAAGRVVQVRDAGGANVYLTGIVVASNAGGCAPAGPAKKGTLDLQRPSPAPDANAQGEVEMAKKGGEQELEVNAKNLDGGAAAPYSAHLETALGSGVFAPIGVLQPKPGVAGRFELKLEGHCAPPATLGVLDLADLTGRKVQVRDAADQVILQGKCPEMVSAAGKLNFTKKTKLLQPNNPPSPKATGTLRVKFNAPQGQSELEVDTKYLATGNSYSVWMEDGVASGVFAKVGDLGSKGPGGKHGEFEAETKSGGSLPFGVTTVGELSSRLVEVRDGNGVAHLVGQVP